MENANALTDQRARRVAILSLVVSAVLMAVKFWAFEITGSQAVFSDAMESIVNVVAAGLAVILLAAAQKPADREHPYGHGKLEFFSAAFEGGLIAFASMMICFEAALSFVDGVAIERIGEGVVLTIAAGVVNAALGIYLIRSGRRHQSAALVASGHHVLSDFYTSAGVVVALGLIHVTGVTWLDPLIALVMGVFLGWTGIRLVRESIGGLLDEENREIIKNLAEIVGETRPPGIIQLHHARVMRSGRYHHIDAHAVVPQFWNVAQAHESTSAFEADLMKRYPYQGELHLHVDPCRQAYCPNCNLPDCPIRRQPFENLRPLGIDELTNPDEPEEFRSSGQS